MKKFASFGVILASSALLGSCSEALPGATAAVNSTADSYFVLGVAPSNMMLQIDEAVIQDRKLVRFVNMLPLHFYGQTDGPYVLVKAKPGAVLAIHSASIMAGHSFFGVRYHPIGDTLTFQAPAGSVVYVTDVAYTFERSGFHAQYRQNFQGAKDFLELHYPQLSGKLEQDTYGLVACPAACRG